MNSPYGTISTLGGIITLRVPPEATLPTAKRLSLLRMAGRAMSPMVTTDAAAVPVIAPKTVQTMTELMASPPLILLNQIVNYDREFVTVVSYIGSYLSEVQDTAVISQDAQPVKEDYKPISLGELRRADCGGESACKIGLLSQIMGA